ncbi:MAG: ABC transporter ATP-binding protein [bacterium]|nr:ABC transporter ATP-binding protein [bacterium]
MARIEAEAITKVYPLADGGERLAIDDISLTVPNGEFVCLLGPSGCGKTTLLNVLSGLDRADAGRVRLVRDDGAPAKLGYVFQEARLLPWLSVADNLRFVVDERGAEAERLVDYWLQRVGIPGRGPDYPRQLSIGQRQRVAVARALIIRPDVLFMDEPFSSLDEITAGRMREELLDLWAELRSTVVFVTHNPLEATFLADRIVVMTPGPGRIVADYRVSDLIPRPRDGDDPRLWEASRVAVRALRSAP